MRGRDVALYVGGPEEAAVLAPIGVELEGRGAAVRTVTDFSTTAEVGLYACHSSRFFDFDAEEWRRPANACSVLALHDFGQHDGSPAGYFDRESWQVFDLGLLPGPDWYELWQQQSAAGAPGPVRGMRTVGWPKMDWVHAEPDRSAAEATAVRNALGLDDRPVVLLACSWANAQQLRDALAQIDPERHQILVKYPEDAAPPAAGPWAQRIMQGVDDRRAARDLAVRTPSVAVAADDADIATLVSISDVVLSNGSNVLYEGVLLDVPGISVVDWEHPAGEHGEQTTRPRIELPGVLSGHRTSIGDMLRVVSHPAWVPLVRGGSARLVAPEHRGTGAERAADAIAEAVEWADALSPEARAEIEAEVVRLRLAGRELVAREQLRYYESELAATREVLRTATERELVARKQLDHYETQLAATQEALRHADAREQQARVQLSACVARLAELDGADP